MLSSSLRIVVWARNALHPCTSQGLARFRGWDPRRRIPQCRHQHELCRLAACLVCVTRAKQTPRILVRHQFRCLRSPIRLRTGSNQFQEHSSWCSQPLLIKFVKFLEFYTWKSTNLGQRSKWRSVILVATLRRGKQEEQQPIVWRFLRSPSLCRFWKCWRFG